jgi:hypothetical protein
MRVIKLTIVGLVILLTGSLVFGIYYFQEAKRLNRKIELLCIPPYDCGKWDKLTIGILLEVLKKQNIHIRQVKNIFTFYGTEFIYEIKTSDIPWQAFDYDNIDMHYDKSYDKIMIFGADIFLLFKDSTLIDYRHNGDRDFLNKYLKGNILIDD